MGEVERRHVRGTFDLKLEPSAVAVFPSLFSAKFINVEAWAVHPVLDDVVVIDDVLNLSGLVGGQVLRDPTRTLFKFNGETDDGSSVELFARTRGPWLYMRGQTTPPEGSADFFQYSIRALAHLRPWADRNEDGSVDAADLTALTGDPTRSGVDFLQWQRQLGETPPPEDILDAELDAAIASAGSAFSAAPEPASAALAAGLALFACRRAPGH